MNKECNICQKPNLSIYVDGRVKGGGWADMCLGCFRKHGVGLGLGKGQKYMWSFDRKRFVKVEG